jgi:hypothetical protein
MSSTVKKVLISLVVTVGSVIAAEIIKNLYFNDSAVSQAYTAKDFFAKEWDAKD